MRGSVCSYSIAMHLSAVVLMLLVVLLFVSRYIVCCSIFCCCCFCSGAMINEIRILFDGKNNGWKDKSCVKLPLLFAVMAFLAVVVSCDGDGDNGDEWC